MNKKNILILAILTAAAGCATNGNPNKGAKSNGTCPDSVGATTTNLFYGDSQIRLTPISKVRENSELRFHLKPQKNRGDKVDYEAIVVEVKFKPVANPPTWLENKDSYNNAPDNTLTVCVPPGAALGTVWEFYVDIPGIGKIDPRAEVVN